ncbi:MAG: hypothetical protein DRP55_05210 [Spirochaetes bacterium]|nr:MAG: hypothetical protein DRP55_05210 [Spirochaetota bacterium]
MKLNKKIWILVILMLFSSIGINAEVINGIACKVDDSIITIHEFNVAYQNALNKSLALGKKPPSKKQVMESLIEKLLIEEEAKQRGVVVTDEEINDIISKIKNENRLTDKKFREELKREGLTIEGLKEDYRLNILKNRLINQMISEMGYKVSEDEIKKFYNDPKNKKYFLLPPIVKLSEIFIKVPENLSFKDQLTLKNKVVAIYNEAKETSNFIKLIEEYSEDPKKNENHGELGSFSIQQLAMWIGTDNAETVFSLDKGDIVPPIRLPEGYYIFKIEDKRDRRVLSLEEAHDQIKSYLLKKKGAEIFDKWIAEKKKSSYIQYLIEME